MRSLLNAESRAALIYAIHKLIITRCTLLVFVYLL